MYAFPLLTNLDKADALFSILADIEAPAKFTYRYLSGIGFASSSDRELIPFLKALGLLDIMGHPTKSYFEIKDKGSFNKFLSVRITEIYKELFEADANVSNVPSSTLAGYFGRLSGSSTAVSTQYASTFLYLCRIAGFKSPSPVNVDRKESRATVSSPKLNVNIAIPATTDERVYETLFKHLKDLLSQ